MVKASEREVVRMFDPYISTRARRRVVEVLESGRIGTGPVVAELEHRFERDLNVPDAIAVSSCTAALHLALVCAGIGPGDEVITTPQTFIATAMAILQTGACVVFADIQPDTGTLDPADVARRISRRTKAILPVHWGGYPCDMDELQAIAEQHGLDVIEDAAHAIGAMYRGKWIGGLSRFTCFSFQAVKHVTAGDGGMLTATRHEDADTARRLRWFGIDRARRRPSILGEPEWDVREHGFKYTLNDIAAAMAVEHLADLASIVAERRRHAAMYDDALGSLTGIRLPARSSDRQSAFWLYDLHAERREDLIRALAQRDVEASVLHRRIDRNSLFAEMRSDLPAMTAFDETHLCLPIHNRMNDDDVLRVIDAVKQGW